MYNTYVHKTMSISTMHMFVERVVPNQRLTGIDRLERIDLKCDLFGRIVIKRLGMCLFHKKYRLGE